MSAVPPPVSMCLYVTGTTPHSTRAVVNIRRICELWVKEYYELEVVDLLEYPGRAREDGVVATPTLILRRPEPQRRFIGDLARTESLFAAMAAGGMMPAPMAGGVPDE